MTLDTAGLEARATRLSGVAVRNAGLARPRGE
jgi:hypothetical protein